MLGHPNFDAPSNATNLHFVFQIVGMDELQHCNRICLPPSNATGIIGNFTCQVKSEFEGCQVEFDVSRDLASLPPSFDINLHAISRAHAITWNVSSTIWPKEGPNTYFVFNKVTADPDRVMFGFEPTMVQLALQPVMREERDGSFEQGYIPFEILHKAGDSGGIDQYFNATQLHLQVKVKRSETLSKFKVELRNENYWLLVVVEIVSVAGALLSLGRILMILSEGIYYQYSKRDKGIPSWWNPYPGAKPPRCVQTPVTGAGGKGQDVALLHQKVVELQRELVAQGRLIIAQTAALKRFDGSASVSSGSRRRRRAKRRVHGSDVGSDTEPTGTSFADVELDYIQPPNTTAHDHGHSSMATRPMVSEPSFPSPPRDRESRRHPPTSPRFPSPPRAGYSRPSNDPLTRPMDSVGTRMDLPSRTPPHLISKTYPALPMS